MAELSIEMLTNFSKSNLMVLILVKNALEIFLNSKDSKYFSLASVVVQLS